VEFVLCSKSCGSNLVDFLRDFCMIVSNSICRWRWCTVFGWRLRRTRDRLVATITASVLFSLSTVHELVNNFKYEVRPYYVKHQKNWEEAIEYVVSWKHFDDLRRLDCGAVEDPCRVNPQPGHNPGHSKTGKKNVAGTLVVGVLTHLGRL